MSKNKKPINTDLEEDETFKGLESTLAENEDSAIIPVTTPKLKCIFVSDGVYKYVDENGKDVK